MLKCIFIYQLRIKQRVIPNNITFRKQHRFNQ